METSGFSRDCTGKLLSEFLVKLKGFIHFQAGPMLPLQRLPLFPFPSPYRFFIGYIYLYMVYIMKKWGRNSKTGKKRIGKHVPNQLRLCASVRSVEDVDLYPAGLAERGQGDSLLGPTFSCIVAQQFHDLKHGDRFWYENNRQLDHPFTTRELHLHIPLILCICTFCEAL